MFSSCSVKINTPEVPKAFTQNAVVTSGDFSYECEICKKEGSVSITVKILKKKMQQLLFMM